MKYTKTIRASKNVRPARRVSASRASLQRRSVKADDEIIEDIPAPAEDAPVAEEAEVTVDAGASELLFEAEDVAELIAEVTDTPVDVTVDEDQVVFTVGDDEYTITPEGNEEIVEESRRVRRSARSVKAGRRMVRRPSARRVAASRRAMASRKVAASRRVVARRPATARKIQK